MKFKLVGWGRLSGFGLGFLLAGLGAGAAWGTPADEALDREWQAAGLASMVRNYSSRAVGSGDAVGRVLAGVPENRREEWFKIAKQNRIKKLPVFEAQGFTLLSKTSASVIRVELSKVSPGQVMIQGHAVELRLEQGALGVFQAIYTATLKAKLSAEGGWEVGFSKAFADTPNQDAAEQSWAIGTFLSENWEAVQNFFGFGVRAGGKKFSAQYQCDQFANRTRVSQDELKKVLKIQQGAFFGTSVEAQAKAFVGVHNELLVFRNQHKCRAPRSDKLEFCREIDGYRACVEHFLDLLKEAWSDLKISREADSSWKFTGSANPVVYNPVQNTTDKALKQ